MNQFFAVTMVTVTLEIFGVKQDARAGPNIGVDLNEAAVPEANQVKKFNRKAL